MSTTTQGLEELLCREIACGERLYINAGRFCQYDELCKRCTDKINRFRVAISLELTKARLDELRDVRPGIDTDVPFLQTIIDDRIATLTNQLKESKSNE